MNRRGPDSVVLNVSLTRGVRDLIDRAITGGRYGSASEYVRALIVRERRRSGDKVAAGIDSKVKLGRRPRAA
jgi:Arc/MetJ-type ribon-helix-helix transcriptional regulator